VIITKKGATKENVMRNFGCGHPEVSQGVAIDAMGKIWHASISIDRYAGRISGDWIGRTPYFGGDRGKLREI